MIIKKITNLMKKLMQIKEFLENEEIEVDWLNFILFFKAIISLESKNIYFR